MNRLWIDAIAYSNPKPHYIGVNAAIYYKWKHLLRVYVRMMPQPVKYDLSLAMNSFPTMGQTERYLGIEYIEVIPVDDIVDNVCYLFDSHFQIYGVYIDDRMHPAAISSTVSRFRGFCIRLLFQHNFEENPDLNLYSRINAV